MLDVAINVARVKNRILTPMLPRNIFKYKYCLYTVDEIVMLRPCLQFQIQLPCKRKILNLMLKKIPILLLVSLTVILF